MRVPEEFSTFVQFFYSGNSPDSASLDDIIADNLKYCNERTKYILGEFIGELLSGRYSDEELAKIWNEQAPTFKLSIGGHRFLLTKARELLDPTRP
jgi:hypothetical protein